MPDFTMCPGTDCPQAATCVRATATPAPERQSWFHEPPYTFGDCDFYWPAPSATPSPSGGRP